MKHSLFLVFLSWTLPACFASTGLDEDGCEPNPCEWTVVDYCEESRECGVFDWCGETIYCELDPPSSCTEPRPVCADSVEMSVCPGNADCVYVDWCDQGFFCVSESCNPAIPECPGGQMPDEVACAPGEFGCTALTGCHEGLYCHEPYDCFDPIFEPCVEATSTVWASGEGECPDFDSDAYCYDENYCGAQRYCVTACAPGDNEVFHPSECVNPHDCYPANPIRDDLAPSWCQGGGGPSCRATPTCDEGSEEIPLGAPCADSGYCEFRSVCSTTIQCMYFVVVG